MKKAIFILSLLLFISCIGDEDNISRSQIAGKWNFSKVWYEIDAVSSEAKRLAESDKLAFERRAKYSYVEFTREGKFTDTYEDVSNVDYKIKGDQIYFKEGTNSEYTWQFNIKGNTLTLIFDETEEFQNEFPEGRVKDVIFYWEYTLNTKY